MALFERPMLSLRETQTKFAAAVLEGADAACAVYRNNVFGCLTRALANTYPVVEKLVGEGFFKYAASQYIARHPSRSGNLDEFGGSFSGFLRGFAPAAGLVYLPDVAQLEWLCHQVLLAADCPPPGARLHPAVALFASDWPVHRIWQVNQPGWTGDTTVDLGLGGVKLAVKRAGHRIELLPFEEGMAT